MIISEKLLNAINAQVSHEFGATILYVHIASYFDNEDLVKLAEIFFEQAEEENPTSPVGQNDKIVFKPFNEPEYLIHGHGRFSMIIMPDRLVGMKE